FVGPPGAIERAGHIVARRILHRTAALVEAEASDQTGGCRDFARIAREDLRVVSRVVPHANFVYDASKEALRLAGCKPLRIQRRADREVLDAVVSRREVADHLGRLEE